MNLAQLTKNQKLAAGAVAVVAALALYQRAKAGPTGAGTSSTSGTPAADTSATDLVSYVDQQNGALSSQFSDVISKLQSQVNHQGKDLAWAGGQLARQTKVIHQDESKIAALTKANKSNSGPAWKPTKALIH